MIMDTLVATYETIQDRRRRTKLPPGPLDVRLPLDRIQRVYAQHAWTSDDPLKNLQPAERLAILTMAPTWSERFRILRLRNEPHRQRSAMIDVLCERRLQYDLATSFALQQPIEQRTLPPMAPALSPYYQHRMDLLKDTTTTMLTARKLESERTLAHSPDAQNQKDRMEEIRKHLVKLTKDVKRALESKPHTRKGRRQDDEDEAAPNV